jgi:ATP-dependent Lhr-like helicase
MSHDAFARLARPIQQILWDMQWDTLRPIQVQAIHEILDGDRDLIISARTAAGKTEAAFLPILSILCEAPQPSIQAMYVGPLKALINDQFRRLEDLCHRAEIPVHRWHGDVDAAQKRQLLEEPRGVLLITPESIESLFINHSAALSRLFQNLGFAVLDELHAFVGRERGTHLRSLLFRIRRLTQGDFRLIALSATLGDGLPKYCEWMRPGGSDRVLAVHDPGEQKQVLYRIHACLATEPRREPDDPSEPDELGIPDQIIDDIYLASAGKKNLLFANSKENVECFSDALNQRCRHANSSPEFLVHHGSLSKDIREHTEELMRGDRPYTTLCSSTLELGIDIGHVAAVGQIGAPWSVSSLVQRMGRSGRKEGEPQVMRIFLLEKQLNAKNDLVTRLRPELLRAIALTELMLAKWVEPPQIDEYDLSTLVQQILSILAQTGGIKARMLFELLVPEAAFRELDERLFAGVLRGLGQLAVIEQMPDGDLILAPKGEAVVRHYSFYSAFATPVEYAVLFDGRTIGQIPSLSVPREGEHLLLGGRRWEVAQVNHTDRAILVIPARGRKPPRFSGEAGEIHPKVREVMRETLFADRPYPYLDRTAATLLERARQDARAASLPSRPFVELSESRCVWFTWTGTRIQRTLCLMARLFDMEATDEDVAILFAAPVADVLAAYRNLLHQPPTPHDLAKAMSVKWIRKFDELVAEPLLVESLAHDFIDLDGAIETIHRAFPRRQTK